MFGAALFVPAFESVRESHGFPAPSHPLYLWIIASWIFLFGVCYLWLGITGRSERLFLAIGVLGKFAFVAILFAFWQMGEVPMGTALNSLPDLLFAVLFAVYLWQSRSNRRRRF
jgi:hypothetical protein